VKRRQAKCLHVCIDLARIGLLLRVTVVEMGDELNKLESLLQERTAELENVKRELDSLGFSISHDLRAPLRAIIGFAELLREGCADKLPPESKRHLDILCNQAQRLNDMIGSLLVYSRLGRQPMHVTRVDMKTVAAEAFTALSSQEHNRAFEFNLGDLPPAWGDRELLGVVWKNLIANAIKFTRQNPKPAIEVTGDVETSNLVYHVRDNGAGFDPRYAERLFGMFQRLHPEGAFEGLGSGLAIAQRIINRHAGRIWAESSPGQGAVFHFSLPVRCGAEMTSE
jgi:light-regulated signal transduction histidine kinase (bacteriophytochrome)